MRCARFSTKEVQIFVGGGITIDSNANDEFKETEIKSQTLLSVIKKIELRPMTSSLRVQVVVDILKKHQVKNIVFSPGSRNAPLVIGFNGDNYFKKRC